MVLGTWGQCLHDLKATTGMNKKIGSKKENNESEHFGFDTEIPWGFASISDHDSSGNEVVSTMCSYIYYLTVPTNRSVIFTNFVNKDGF
jgi:hypothetical protein